MASKIGLEFAIRNRANRQLIEEVLPTPENQQRNKEIDDGPTPPRFRLIYFSRFFDRKIDLWFSLHGYPLIRTVHTGVSHFQLSVEVSYHCVGGRRDEHGGSPSCHIQISPGYCASLTGSWRPMRSFCHDVVEIHLYYAVRHAAFAAVLGSMPAFSCNRTVERSRRSYHEAEPYASLDGTKEGSRAVSTTSSHSTLRNPGKTNGTGS